MNQFLAAEVAVFLAGLTRTQQRQLIALLFKLAEDPTQKGDYASTDSSGRVLQNILIGKWVVTFWPDHAVKELRIVEVALV